MHKLAWGIRPALNRDRLPECQCRRLHRHHPVMKVIRGCQTGVLSYARPQV